MERNKLKIRFFHPDLGIGGAERLVLDIAVVLLNEGHDVSFITNHCNINHAFEEIKNGVFPVEVIGDWLPRNILGRFQALCAYLRMIYLAFVYVFFTNKSEDDIYFVDQIPVAIPILRWTNKRIVYYCHHPDLLASPAGGCLKKFYRLPIDWTEYKCTAQADVLLVNSEYTATIFRKTFPKIKKDIEILYPTIANSFQEMVLGSNASKPVSELIPEITNHKPEDVIFLSINRFHPAKNLQLAINAMEILRNRLSGDKFDKIYLVLAGGYDPQSSVNAEYFFKLVSQTRIKNMEDRIIFIKSPSESTKLDLLRVCDCLLYTPVKEHFGIVPLEAMICAKPVIACDSGGPKETIEHGVNGYLCDCTAESLAEFMEKMLDKDVAQNLGKAGRNRQKEKFSYHNFVEGVKSVISNVK